MNPPTPPSDAVDGPPPFDGFPYGTQYHRAPTPASDEWDGDLAEIARAGYTHVQFRPQWRRHERVRGRYVWDDLDRLCDLAGKHRLRVVVKSMLETAPDWVFDELGGERVGFRGQPLPPFSHAAFYVGGWWPCFDNPAVRGAAFEFNRRLAERYGAHPALWFFNAWNEPRSRPAGDCQCAHSIRSYRDWLRRRFGGVEALNDAYGKEWTSLESVRPPQSASDHAEMHLWRQWAAESVASRLRLSYEGLKAGAPERTVMAHVGCSSVVQDPVCDTSDDLKNARQVDFYGCSFPVPLWPSNLVEACEPLYQSAWMRRVDPRFWIQEFYPNEALWCRPPSPERLRQILWMALAGGCRGFTFWQFRSERFGEESNGWGMREIDGSPNARSLVCDEAAARLAAFGAELARAPVEPSRVGLLYHRDGDSLARLQEITGDFYRIEREPPRTDYPARRALRAAVAMYRMLGHNVDFAVPGDDFSRFSLLHVTATEMVEPALARALARYVEGGGVLYVSFPFACREANTWLSPARPAHGLAELLGCREGERLRIPEPGRDGATACWDKTTARAGGWRIELEPCGGEVRAHWTDSGRPAVVEHRVGAGRVFAAGANVELGWDGRPDAPELSFPARALRAAGLEQTTRPLSWDIRRGAFRFVFNPGDEPIALRPEEGESPVYAAGFDSAAGRLEALGVAVFRETRR